MTPGFAYGPKFFRLVFIGTKHRGCRWIRAAFGAPFLPAADWRPWKAGMAVGLLAVEQKRREGGGLGWRNSAPALLCLFRLSGHGADGFPATEKQPARWLVRGRMGRP